MGDSLFTYANIVLELDPSGGVEVDLLQCLSHNIVGLSFAGLGRLDSSGLVHVSFVVDIELTEGLCQAEYVALLELGELPVLMARWSAPHRSVIAQAWARGSRPGPYLCSLRTFMIADIPLFSCWLEVL